MAAVFEEGNVKKIPCEIYSRVVGYFRPLGQWNRGKQAEFWDRKNYKVSGEFNPENEIRGDQSCGG